MGVRTAWGSGRIRSRTRGRFKRRLMDFYHPAAKIPSQHLRLPPILQLWERNGQNRIILKLQIRMMRSMIYLHRRSIIQANKWVMQMLSMMKLDRTVNATSVHFDHIDTEHRLSFIIIFESKLHGKDILSQYRPYVEILMDILPKAKEAFEC
ncbi:hypothetical protein BC829DRAFT_405146 [Chytridium lagenaria]|nr:hypothetical protein BC829DRAFT_405146 [Chytridium lagenaria]